MIKKMKELTDEEYDILHSIFTLVRNGKIPFGALEPVYKDSTWSKRIEDYLKEEEKLEKQYQLGIRKEAVERCNKALVCTKEKLNKTNDYLIKLRADLEEARNVNSLDRENRIRNLLWWIFNNEEEVERLEKELKQDEDWLRKAEEDLYEYFNLNEEEIKTIEEEMK